LSQAALANRTKTYSCRAAYMIDTHVLDHMIETRVINYTKCLQEEEGTVEALHVHDLHGVFYMYLAGILVSTGALVSELVYSMSQSPSRCMFTKTKLRNAWRNRPRIHK
ncbi:unnamed protein product, partial [Ixodes hexagonus]